MFGKCVLKWFKTIFFSIDFNFLFLIIKQIEKSQKKFFKKCQLYKKKLYLCISETCGGGIDNGEHFSEKKRKFFDIMEMSSKYPL